MIIKLTYGNFIVLLLLDYGAVKMGQQASSWKQLLPKIGPTIIYIRRKFDNWVMRFYLSGFPLVGKAKHSSFSKYLSRIEWKSHNQCPWLASMSVYMTNGKSGTTKLVFTYNVAKSWTKKSTKIGANLHLIWAGCHSCCQGTCFSAYTQNLTKKFQYTLCPTPPEQTNSIPQYPRYFWMCFC